MVEDERDEPCYGCGVDDFKCDPFPARLTSDGGECGDAREVEQDEEHERIGDNRVEDVFAVGLGGGLQFLLERCVLLVGIGLAGVEHAHRRDDNLLGCGSREHTHAHLPVEAQRLHQRLDGLTHLSHVGVFNPLLRRLSLVAGEVTQRPHDDGSGEDDGRHLLQVLFALAPHVDGGIARSGFAVRRQFHHKLRLVMLQDGLA